ncbi:hypothetical protein [Saccharopolyspora mangrovi]|uniref:MinD-like ATPase involved in chromosome partitioning or flagellar assembly n=1 Tax=Saccharopolyspora mangrovi TaxID=3082379 RepID=A0ABU6AIC6_9PSEU|nr:hypothetical protein [Saccharopolyspora sp. S2-29]MEB3371318.1 hypothetical protein [Saccharopolyspora sp. S2-29]
MVASGQNSLGHNGFRNAATASLARTEQGEPSEPPAAGTTPPSLPEPERTATATQWPCAPSPADTEQTQPHGLADQPSPAPAEPGGLENRDRCLARAASPAWPELPTADIVGAVEAGQWAAAATTTSSGNDAGDQTDLRTAAQTGQAAAAVQRQGLSPISDTHADWAGFGELIPVLAASPGAGASLVAAVLADALQLAEQRVLLVDTADPARSGLAAAARSEGPALDGPHPSVRIRFSWRAQALLARVETELPVITPGMVPPPRFFKPKAQSVQATVVDLGHDAWRVAAHPLAGAGAWLRAGTPMPKPVLVCRATRPSLLHAEQVLARLDAWNGSGATTPPTQLVVVSAKRWPTGVRGSAGRRVSALLDDALFLPHDPDIATSGIRAEVTPTRLRAAITPLLRRWELLPQTASSAGRLPGLSRRSKGATSW